jgi:hypothetical protein
MVVEESQPEQEVVSSATVQTVEADQVEVVQNVQEVEAEVKNAEPAQEKEEEKSSLIEEDVKSEEPKLEAEQQLNEISLSEQATTQTEIETQNDEKQSEEINQVVEEPVESVQSQVEPIESEERNENLTEQPVSAQEQPQSESQISIENEEAGVVLSADLEKLVEEIKEALIEKEDSTIEPREIKEKIDLVESKNEDELEKCANEPLINEPIQELETIKSPSLASLEIAAIINSNPEQADKTDEICEKIETVNIMKTDVTISSGKWLLLLMNFFF